jgi:hypothetical protein
MKYFLMIFGILFCFQNTKAAPTKMDTPFSNDFCEETGLIGCEETEDNRSGIERSYLYTSWIPYALKTLFNAGAGISVLVIVYSGFILIGSQLDMFESWSTDNAKNNIKYALIGLLIMLLARVIVQIIETLPLG